MFPVGNPSYRTKTPEEFFANARLCKASPDLYKALKGILSHPGFEMLARSGYPIDVEPVWRAALAAIAKAEKG